MGQAICSAKKTNRNEYHSGGGMRGSENQAHTPEDTPFVEKYNSSLNRGFQGKTHIKR
jgi:hypothetical protein